MGRLRGLQLIAIGCLATASLLFSGCKSFRSVTVDPREPLTVSADEAREMQRQGKLLYDQQPRIIAQGTRAAKLLEQAARALPEDYAAQIEAARALAFVAERAPTPAERLDAAKRGVVVSRHARELQADNPAGHYWYAMTVGLVADVDRDYGLAAIGEMDQALTRAIALDETYDYAAPLRLMGILHLRTPAPPVGVGSKRKALRTLQRAVELFPDYPENYLYLAEAQHHNGALAEAEASLNKLMGLLPWQNQLAESEQWRNAAAKLRATWTTP